MAITLVAVLQAVSWLVLGQPRLSHEQLRLVADFAPATVAFAVAGSIPLGFVVYQLYYLSYNRGTRLFGLVAMQDRGADVLVHMPPSCVAVVTQVMGVTPQLHAVTYRTKFLGIYPLLRFRPEARTVTQRRKYCRRREENFRIVRSLVDLACEDSGTNELKKEYTTLSDIYHAQGAARTAVTLSFAVNGLLVLSRLPTLAEVTWQAWGLAIVATLGLSGALYVVLSRVRDGTLQSAQATLKYGLFAPVSRLAGNVTGKPGAAVSP